MAAQKCIVATADDAGKRLDTFLSDHDCYASRSSAARHCESGDVLVGGNPAIKRYAVRAGDAIVYAEEELVEHLPLVGEPIPLDIRYEDEHLIVLSKQAGLCVHPSPGHEGSTLVNALIYRFGRDNLSHIQGDDRPGIVHRLDMDTSGLMLCAKDDETGNALQEDIRLREVDRRYLTLVHGNMAHDTGMVDAPIARHPKERLRMCVSNREDARPSVTTFKVLERFEAGAKDDGYTLLECKLFTGRTHQIRVHMEYVHHCCVGDPLYSSGSEASQLGLTRQFLHSHTIEFTHPVTGEVLRFEDVLPSDLQQALDSIAARSMGRTPYGRELLRTDSSDSNKA